MKTESPLISVIVPIYNIEKYLDRCLESIFAQSYQNLEIILVDDGSTDKSGSMVDEYKKRHKNVKVIHKENGGLSSARNEGIKHSSGEWLVFIDSDDYVDKNFVNDLFRLTRKRDVDIATCSFESFTDDNSVLKKSPTWPDGVLSGDEAIDDMMKNKRPAYIWLSMFRAALFRDNKIKFPVGREYEDIATRIKLFYYAKKVAYCNKKNYKYLIRAGSITGKEFSETRYNDFLFALSEVRSFLSESQHEYRYLTFFEFYSLFTLLNYLARESGPCQNTKMYWDIIRDKLNSIYSEVVFPSLKSKMLYTAMLLLSKNGTLYSILYRKAKK